MPGKSMAFPFTYFIIIAVTTLIKTAYLAEPTIPAELYGCSIAGAQKIKSTYAGYRPNSRWSIPDFRGLHTTIALPFHYLVCEDYSVWSEKLRSVGPNDFVKFYEARQIREDSRWKNMLAARIGFVPGQEPEPTPKRIKDPPAESEEKEAFNPRFRLLILTTSSNTTGRLISD